MRTGGWTRANSSAPPMSMFISFGADAFAERTRRELLATGEKVRKRSDETRGQLTAQEEQIARLAARRADESGDRRAALPQPAHGRVAPAQGVHEARRRLPHAAARQAARRRTHWRTGLATETADQASDQGLHGRDGACPTRKLPP